MTERKIKKTGYLWKQGGSFKSWKVRYFILTENCLEYYKDECEEIPKGIIYLRMGRGVRTRDQCDLEWPDKAKPGRSFGLAVENRTFYFYGDDPAAVRDWISSIQETISKIGIPSDDCSSDAQSNTEKKVSKAMRSGVKIMNRVAKKFSKQKESAEEGVSDSTAVDYEIEEVYDNVAINHNATGNSLEEVNDGVEATETGCSDNDSFTTNTEVYENLEISHVVKSGQSSIVMGTQDEATVQTPLEEETESDEFDDDDDDDDDSFTSEIYENLGP